MLTGAKVERMIQCFGLAEELPPGYDSGPHRHRAHQVLYSAHGTMHLVTSAGSWQLPPQHAAWLPADTEHHVTARKGAALRTAYLAPKSVSGLSHPRVFLVSPLAREMLIEATRWGESRHSDSVADRFFAALAALLPGWVSSSVDLRLPLPRSEELLRVVHTIETRMIEPLTLSRVARDAALSTRTLERRFEEELSMGFRQYLLRARILRAAEALAVPGARVRQVAHAVGFSSEAAFTRSFQGLLGKTPSEFRKAARVGSSEQGVGKSGKGPERKRSR